MKSASRWLLARCSASLSAVLAGFRVAAFFGTIVALAVGFALRGVRADIHETLEGVGAEIMLFPGVNGEEPRDVHLNGVRVSLRTQAIDEPLSRVLAHYERVCVREGAQLFERIADTLGAREEVPVEVLASIATLGVRRQSSGYVACVAPASSFVYEGAVGARFLRFARTKDLGELGGLRFAYAQRADGDASAKTLLLTIWADAGLKFGDLLPGEIADAAGRDVEGLPRAPDTQRLLSAWEAERPSGVVVYRARRQSPSDIESFYRSALPAHGWSLVERHPGESIQINGVRMLTAQKGPRTVMLLAHPMRGGRTTLTVLASEPS